MISKSWQILKGLIIVLIIIIGFSVLLWFLEKYEEIAVTLGISIVILAGIFGVIFIIENLFKLFKSWWNGPPPAST